MIALLLPLVALVLLIVRAELVLKQGKRWTVAIGGYDPRDLIRGHYLQYRVRWKKDPNSTEACTDRDGDCYLCLRRESGDPRSRPEPLVQWVRGLREAGLRQRFFGSGRGEPAQVLYPRGQRGSARARHPRKKRRAWCWPSVLRARW